MWLRRFKQTFWRRVLILIKPNAKAIFEIVLYTCSHIGTWWQFYEYGQKQFLRRLLKVTSDCKHYLFTSWMQANPPQISKYIDEEQRVGSTYFGAQEIQHRWEMKQIILDKPNNATICLICQFISVDVCQGTAIFKHHLIPTSVWAH